MKPRPIAVCIVCKIEKEISCKEKCYTCYNTTKDKIRMEKIRQDPDKLAKFNARKAETAKERRKNRVDFVRKIGEKGEGCYTSHGYIKVGKKGHPNANKRGMVLKHVMVMSEYLGRPIQKHETIHHKNGIKDDNRIENLELWSSAHPPGQRVEDKIKFYKEFIALYEHNKEKKDEEE
jgi:hypothetical protein